METNDTRTLGLLLTDGFALMSYASIIEPHRAANVLAGRDLYRWVHISPDGLPVRASNGANIVPNQAVGDPLECNTLFVFAAGDPASFSDSATFAWLRRLALTSAVVVGVSGGPFLLASAGILDGYRATIHWDHQLTFTERFPTVLFQPNLYVIDRRRVTCAGGIAGLDLAIEMIEREQGHALAVKVSEWFIRTESRSADDPQRLSLRDRYAIRDDRVLKVLAHMEANVEELSGRDALARVAGVSVRQLERLFVAHLHETVRECYLRIRMDQAEQLLLKTSMSATAIATACGFHSSSQFSQSFKKRYGRAPTESRR